jgi:hypothetical protein
VCTVDDVCAIDGLGVCGVESVSCVLAACLNSAVLTSFKPTRKRGALGEVTKEGSVFMVLLYVC